MILYESDYFALFSLYKNIFHARFVEYSRKIMQVIFIVSLQ